MTHNIEINVETLTKLEKIRWINSITIVLNKIFKIPYGVAFKQKAETRLQFTDKIAFESIGWDSFFVVVVRSSIIL